MSRLSRAALWVLDESLRAWFAPDCLVCGVLVDRDPVCGACARWWAVDPPWCGKCGASVSQSIERCGNCAGNPLEEARSRLWFHGSARDVLHQIKFSGRFSWLEVFESYFRWPEARDFSDHAIVPVPLAAGRLWERGFNQAAFLGRRFAENHGANYLGHGLEKIRETEAQSGLSKKERHRNLTKAFRWRDSVPVPERVVLIDDVWTTGSTLFACAKALERAGVKEVRGWTLFRTPLRGST